MKLSSHLGFQFNEVPFLERFSRAAHCGYDSVEFPNPYTYKPKEIKSLLTQYGLSLVQIGAPMGETRSGEKGIAALPEKRKEFIESINLARDTALELGCQRVHVMSGKVVNRTSYHDKTYIENMVLAVECFSEVGIETLVEVFCSEEVPGYYMSSFDLAENLFKEITHPKLKFLFDTYHTAANGHDIIEMMKKWLPRTGHIQISDYPGRHEPGTGKLDFDSFFKLLDENNYGDWVGCEYRPIQDTQNGLEYLNNLLKVRKFNVDLD